MIQALVPSWENKENTIIEGINVVGDTITYMSDDDADYFYTPAFFDHYK